MYAEAGQYVSRSLGRVHPPFQFSGGIYIHIKKKLRACLESSRAWSRAPDWFGTVVLGKHGTDKHSLVWFACARLHHLSPLEKWMLSFSVTVAFESLCLGSEGDTKSGSMLVSPSWSTAGG